MRCGVREAPAARGLKRMPLSQPALPAKPVSRSIEGSGPRSADKPAIAKVLDSTRMFAEKVMPKSRRPADSLG